MSLKKGLCETMEYKTVAGNREIQIQEFTDNGVVSAYRVRERSGGRKVRQRYFYAADEMKKWLHENYPPSCDKRGFHADGSYGSPADSKYFQRISVVNFGTISNF